MTTERQIYISNDPSFKNRMVVAEENTKLVDAFSPDRVAFGHNALVWNGGNSIDSYFDGVSQTVTYTVQNNPQFLQSSSAHLCIGARWDGGSISELYLDDMAHMRVYNSALTSQEVNDIMAEDQ